MSTKRKKNPLHRRVLRELTGEWTKYAVIALFLLLTIGFVSGMYVANGSMLTAAEESREKYCLEDGHFELKEKADEKLLAAIESGEKADLLGYYSQKAHNKVDEKLDGEFEDKFRESLGKTLGTTMPEMLSMAMEEAKKSGAYQEAYDKAKEEAYQKADEEVEKKYEEAADSYELNDPDFEARPVTVCENFYRDTTEKRDEVAGDTDTTDGKIRVYPVRKNMDLACVMEGTLPENAEEIAIDRMHADNVGLKVGDHVAIGGKDYTVSGLVANADYSTLFEKNTEMMFDAIGFDVGLVTEEGFDRLEEPVVYNYSFRYAKQAGDGDYCRADGDIQEKEWSDAFLKALATQALAADNELKNYLPAYANQAIQFTKNDIGSDKAMGGVLLYVLIVVLAFVFAITIGNTIQKEAPVIGTLRASGYTRGELLVHYMTSPVLVTLLSAVIGNVLGYTVFKDFVVDMYYNSYSLPSYQTIFSAEAMIKTTVIPVILMFAVNAAVISAKLRHTPLQFLRRDLKKNRRKKAMRLPRWSFPARFRLRVLFQNIPGYLVLFMGILFVMILMAMAVGTPSTLSYYQEKAPDMMLAKYQTILKNWKDGDGEVISTKTEGAEKIAMKTLLRRSDIHDEDISVYGMEEDSRYVTLPSLKEGEAYISRAYADKYGLGEGDTITLDAQYEDASYSFAVAGIWDYESSLAVFLPMEKFRDTFDLEEKEFSGFLSDEEITDIPSKYITTVVTQKDITKIADQLDHSMGSYMLYFQYLCVLLAIVLIYLLTKLIIERNETAISMTKILGYRTGEIASIYLLSTTFVVIVSEIVSVILGVGLMVKIWGIMMQGMDGWFAFRVLPSGYAKMLGFVFAGYLVVMLLDFRRIRKVPLEEALKNAE